MTFIHRSLSRMWCTGMRQPTKSYGTGWSVTGKDVVVVVAALGRVVVYFQMSEVHSLRGGLMDIMVQELLGQAHDAFTVLTREKYISLTTFRKSGKAVVTPVWFAGQSGTIYVESAKNAGKIKRIRHTARVTLAACTLSAKV